jgi:hypothetical protein
MLVIPNGVTPVSFIGNNLYAYSSRCYHFGQEIIGVKHNTDGTLSYLNYNFPFPAEKSGGFYCPWKALPIRRTMSRLRCNR